jgi:hypothetical protein
LQRHVNHSWQMPRRYLRLTQNIKRNRTCFCQERPGTKVGRGRGSRRQMRSGECAGSGRALRLDPTGLPVRFYISDAGADGRVH